ncbi:hypothetical protein PQR02_34040 [Paraburkholderia sediminicola]|uniref:hypothetical protein n=1 Tax=Paraburkholderia sediminicola TaxID=458836 RepID=UPI0038BCC57A
MFLAFSGVVLIAVHSAPSTLTAHGSVFFAFAAALLIALLFRSFEVRIHRGADYAPARSFSYFFGCFVSLSFLLIFNAAGVFSDLGISLRPSEAALIYGGWLGGVVLCLGHILWTSALASVPSQNVQTRASIIGLSYFTPVVSALALQLFFNEHVDKAVLAGLIMIVFANQFLERPADTIDIIDFIGLVAPFAFMFCIFIQPKEVSITMSTIITATAALFAIPTSFHLTYLRTAVDRLREEIVATHAILHSIARTTRPGAVDRVQVAKVVDRLMLLSIKPKSERMRVQFLRECERLQVICESLGKPDIGQSAYEASTKVAAVASSVNTHRGSWLLWCLAINLAVLVLIFRDPGFLGSIFNVVVSVGALVVCYQLNDFTRRGIGLDVYPISLQSISLDECGPHLRRYVHSVRLRHSPANLVPRLMPIALTVITAAYALQRSLS